MKELEKYKKKKRQKIENYFLEKRQKLLDLEHQAPAVCPRIELLNRILLQNFKVVHKNNPTTYLYNPSNQNALEFILEQEWQTIDSAAATTSTMDSSKAT